MHKKGTHVSTKKEKLVLAIQWEFISFKRGNKIIKARKVKHLFFSLFFYLPKFFSFFIYRIIRTLSQVKLSDEVDCCFVFAAQT